MSHHLYWLSGSPHCWRVMLALHIKKIPYTSTRFDTETAEYFDPEFRAINPRGEVPVLMTPDGPVRESLAILAYLDRVNSDPALFGKTAAEAGLIWQWIMDYEGHLRPAMVTMTAIAFGYRDHDAQALAEALKKGAIETRTILHRLKFMPWLGGNDLSAADVTLYPGIQWVRRALGRLPENELTTLMDDPALKRWEAQIEKLPKFAETWPPHWVD